MLTIQHNYAGAAWLESNLRAASACRARSKSKKKRPIAATISPFGAVVADLLGYAFAGLYHMDEDALERAQWDNDRFIEIDLIPRDMSTYDFNLLTVIVLLAHDLCIRVSVSAQFRGVLRLGFWPRRRTGGMAQRHPTLEDHVAEIRSGYTIVDSDPVTIPDARPATVAATRMPDNSAVDPEGA